MPVTLTVARPAKESFVREPGAPLRVWAHRGGSSAAPENTAAADEVARRAGVEWIENDVQPTKDGVPVVLHDDTVDRTTDGSGAIRSLTAAQVAELDAGSWFAPSYAGQRVPTLASQLDGLRARGGNLLLEIKGAHPRESVARIVDEIHGRGMSRRVFVQSFDPQHLHWVREFAPELPLGLRARPAVTILSPAAGERIEQGGRLRVAVGNNSPEPIAITLDGAPVGNGAAIETMPLAVGEHTVTATVAGSTVEITFEVVAPR